MSLVIVLMHKGSGTRLSRARARRLWPNRGFDFHPLTGAIMGNKIKTEADRRATPRPPAPAGATFTAGKGQKVSLERGSHTRSKKNPGKRAKKGG